MPTVVKTEVVKALPVPSNVIPAKLVYQLIVDGGPVVVAVNMVELFIQIVTSGLAVIVGMVCKVDVTTPEPPIVEPFAGKLLVAGTISI